MPSKPSNTDTDTNIKEIKSVDLLAEAMQKIFNDSMKNVQNKIEQDIKEAEQLTFYFDKKRDNITE